MNGGDDAAADGDDDGVGSVAWRTLDGAENDAVVVVVNAMHHWVHGVDNEDENFDPHR